MTTPHPTTCRWCGQEITEEAGLWVLTETDATYDLCEAAADHEPVRA
jgi:hypothetical protein